MGQAKHEWIEAQERGWTEFDTYVCEACVGDDFLARIVKEKKVNEKCCYCQSGDVKISVSPTEAVMHYIAQALFAHFAEPANAGLPVDEGSWVGEENITDTSDALMSFSWTPDDDFFEDIASSFCNDSWYPCADGHWLEPHEHQRRIWSWDNFCHTIKYKSRYFFTADRNIDPYDRDYYPPKAILDLLGKDILELGLITEIPPNSYIYRTRINNNDRPFTTLEELGPPPSKMAVAGRMNPPGISYGYFSWDLKTASLEAMTPPPVEFGVATFSTRLPLLAVDFTKLPKPPSDFDCGNREMRNSILFLESFIRAISLPVQKNGFQHIEYIPSQVVSEFISQVASSSDGSPIDALIYSSTLSPGGSNIVIFPPRTPLGTWGELVELVAVDNQSAPNWQSITNFLNM